MSHTHTHTTLLRGSIVLAFLILLLSFPVFAYAQTPSTSSGQAPYEVLSPRLASMQAGLFEFLDSLKSFTLSLPKGLTDIKDTVLRIPRMIVERVTVLTERIVSERTSRVIERTTETTIIQPTRDVIRTIEKVVEQKVIEKTVKEEIVQKEKVTEVRNVTNVTEVTKPADLSGLELRIMNQESWIDDLKATVSNLKDDIFDLKLNVPKPPAPPSFVTATLPASAFSSNNVQANQIVPDIVSSLDGVANDGGNIDLIAGANIAITADDTLNQITIALNSAKVPTLAHTFAPWSQGVANSNVSDATIYINPASAASDTNLLGIAVGGSPQFLVDAEGDVFANSITTSGSVTAASTSFSSLTVENTTTLGDAVGDTITINAGTTTYNNSPTIRIPNAGTYTFSDGTNTLFTLTDAGAAGNISSATWQGSVIAGQYGGTGVANTGKTITLGGNLTTAGDLITSGANSLTLTTTGSTNVTFPTTGTLATLGGIETFSGAKTFSADLTFSAATPNIAITNTETFTITDGTNTLMSLADAGTTGNLNITGNATLGSASSSAGAFYAAGAPFTSATTRTTTKIADANNVGYYTSIAIGTDGLPVISYLDLTAIDLAITKCGNAACSSGNTTTKIADANNVGYYTSIAIGTDGLPVISYQDNTATDLAITKCGNAACSSGNTTTKIADANNVGAYTSIAIGTDGLPVISYRDNTATDLAITKCGNAACSSGNTTTKIADANNVGAYTSIAIGTDGLPVISYRDATATDLAITKCGNAACSSGNTTTKIADANDVGYDTAIAIGTDGLPVISHRDATDGLDDLAITKCGNTACSSGNTTTRIGDIFVGYYTSIAIGTDGLPVISHQDNFATDLAITKCGNAACSSGNTTTKIVDASNDGYYTSIAIGTDGLPVISHRDSLVGDLAITKCANASCSSSSGTAVTAGLDLGSPNLGFRNLYGLSASFAGSLYVGANPVRVDNTFMNTSVPFSEGNLFVIGNISAGVITSLHTLTGMLCIKNTTACPAQAAGRLYVDTAGTVVDDPGDVFDIAEFYPASEDVAPGELLSIDPLAGLGQVPPNAVRKSATPYDSALIGIASTSPAAAIEESWFSIGGVIQTDPRKPLVALVGRVRAKVSTENGPINAGDPLTSSSVPGVAMKATKPGPVIGKALESFSDEMQNEKCKMQNGDEVSCGKVMVFVNVSYYIPTEALELVASEGGQTPLGGSDPLTFVDLLFSDITRFFREGLKRLGFFVENGVASVKEIFAEKARLEKLEMIDQDTGEIYCTWIASGEWVKVLGLCDGTKGPGLAPSGGQTPTTTNGFTEPVELSPEAEKTLEEMLGQDAVSPTSSEE